MSDPILYALLFAGSICVYLPIYRFAVARWSSEYVIRAVEKGDINVKRFKHNALAELGTLTRTAGSAEQVAGDPQMMGLEAAGQLLQMVGMKKVPARRYPLCCSTKSQRRSAG